MDLSNDLISKFVKITNDGNKKETKEGIVYGTTVDYDGAMYVKIDGSDLLTPIDTTADIKEGERVTIMIKDHNATVTGNITSPSASSADVKKVTRNVEEIEGEITEFEAIIADVVHVGELDAEVARIDELIAGKATIEDLTATNTEITNLKAKDAEIENLVAEKATIEDLTATNAEITNLKAKDAEIENLVADKASIGELNAVKADINDLQADKADIGALNAAIADIETLTSDLAIIDQAVISKANITDLNAANAQIAELQANKANVADLNAANANINILDTEVADIQTLVNGNLTSDNIASLNLTSANTTIQNAMIKDAMIDSITASKIKSGTIDTNLVTIQSTDGSMILTGSVQQFKDENGVTRIQIGKDTGGNFTFILYDESGTGVLIDEDGIKSSNAIADGLIVDAKVADNANIAGSKLDIASVITEVNNDNSTTIKSNKIYLDEQGQSLEVAFNSLKTQVETIQDVTIDGDLTAVIEQVQSNTTQIEANKEGISTLVAENTIRKEEIQNLDGEIESVNNTLSSKYSSLEQDVSGFKTTVAETYATKQSVTDINNNLSTNYSTTSAMNSAINQKANEITSSVSETYTTKTEFNNLEVGGTNLIYNGGFNRNLDSWNVNGGSCGAQACTESPSGYMLLMDVTSQGHGLYQHFTFHDSTYCTDYVVSFYAKTNVDGSQMYVSMEADPGTHSVFTLNGEWQKCVYKFRRNNTGTNALVFYANGSGARHIYIHSIKMEKGTVPSAWSPHPSEIENKVDNLSNNLTNNYSTTVQMNSAIQQKANEITSSVSETYTTKSETTAVQNQITTSRNLLMGSRDYNLGKWSVEGANILDEWYNGTRIYTTTIAWANMDYWVSDLIDRGVIELSTPYTFSCYVMSTGSDYTPEIRFLADGLPNFSSALCGTATTSWQRISITIEWTSFDNRSYSIRFEATTDSPSGSHLKWACFQLERGRVATGWAPAPEDAQYAINDINSNLSTNYSTTTQMNSAINQKANEIISSVSQTYISNYEAKKLADTTTTGLNKYLFERYQRDGFSYSNRPTLNDLVGARLIESRLVDKPPAHTSDIDENYIGVLTFYLYYDYACTKTVTVTTDDHGTVYLNNVGIYELTSCKPANVTFNMIKGLNRIDIVYAEARGGDGVSWGGVDGWTAFGAYANAVTNEIANRTNELTLAMTQGNMLNTDPTFRNGYNGINIYNNNANGTVVNERIPAIEGCPNTSGYCIKITTNGEASPYLGGFFFGTWCRYNAVFITKITAKIPVGYTIGWASNFMGANGEQKWLSSTSGTGDWYDYYCKVKCGNSGDPGTTNFFYLDGPQASAENPVTWYVSYATVFDVTDSDERITNLTNNLATNYSTTTQMNSAINQKANEITSSVSETYTTKSEFNNLQIGGTNLIQNGNFKGAIPSATYMPSPWAFWGNEIHIFGSNGAAGYNHVGCVYIGCNLTDGSRAGICSNRVPVSKVEKGANYMASFILAIESNVKGATAHLEYLNDTCDQILHSQDLATARVTGNVVNGLYEHQYHIPFTMWTGDFSYVQITFKHGGTNAVSAGYLMIVGNVQIEKGNKATAWSPAPEDVQGQIDATNNNLATNYSTTTQMNSAIQQKANEITSSVSQAYVTKSEAATMNDTVAGNRKWLFEQYTNSQSVGTGSGTYPTLAHLANETLIASRLVNTLPGYASDLGDRYLGVYTVYLYYESAYTWNGSIISDDGSTTYLNGVVVCQAPSCTSTAFTMNFKKGINKLQIIHGEGYGGDGVTLSDLGPWKEYGAYPACVTAASSNYYASNSDIVQTVNDLTIKFTESGGYNLLRNGHGDKGTSYWVNNGGGLSIVGGASGGATGNFFSTSLPNGICYDDWVCLLPNTHYVYQAKVWTYTTFNGDGSEPLRFWFSYDASTTTGDGFTVLDYQQNVTVSGKWTQCYVHFITGNVNIYFKPFIYSGITADTFYVTELMLSQSRVVQPWSPHPSEVYSGITQIDKDGIRVQHSDFNGYTHMAPSGFYVNHNGADVVALDAAGLRVTGSITATSGQIAHYTINEHALVGHNVGLCGHPDYGYWALWSGSSYSGSAPFRVGHGGDLHATNATITGNITASSGHIGGTTTIDGNCLVSGTVGANAIAAGSITANKISAGAITTDKISADAITANKISAGAITTDKISAGAITANKISAGAITTDKISAGAITADKISANAITGKTITGGSITGATITGGSINIGGNFSVSSAGTLTTNSQIYAQGGIYTYQDIRGLDDTHNTGGLTLVSGTGNVAVRTEAAAHSVYIQPASGEAYVTYPASSDLADLRLKNLFSEQTNASVGNFGQAQLYATNAYLEFMYGLGIVRVAEAKHLYLQCGSSSGNTSTEVRCTCYKNPNTYTNIRAYNVCAQNAVYANGVNVSSDINRKRDIELYATDALNEICTTPVYTYHLDTDLDEEVKRIGIIMQEAPLDAIDLSGKGVDLYQMVTMLWKATQQQQEMIEELKEQLKGE